MSREKRQERGAGDTGARRKALRAVTRAIVVFGEHIDESAISLADFVRLLELSKDRQPVSAKRLRVRWVEEW